MRILHLLLLTASLYAQEIAVVYNPNDPDSAELANYYIQQRNIPETQLLALPCPVEETISREAYDTTIAEPLRRTFLERGWWKTEADISAARVTESQIRHVVLMRGIPLKIMPTKTEDVEEFQRDEASVDSELAVLGSGEKKINGYIANPAFHQDGKPPTEQPPWLLRVCRLDAVRPDTVRRMIRDAVEAEKTGLWGFAYIDMRGIGSGSYKKGDEWLQRATDSLIGMPRVVDNAPEIFPNGYPITRAAIYLGWYAENANEALREAQWIPGAVAVHLHSFSASTLRDPLSGWCAPLLASGAAATLGNVYEPYLSLTTHLDIFTEQLRQGGTFADAAYAAQPVLSWMSVFIGDPLYRPFAARRPGTKPQGEITEYVAYALGAGLWKTDPARGSAWLQNKAREMQSGVIWEGLGLLEQSSGQADEALAAWKQAVMAYTQDPDRIRCTLHTIAHYRRLGQNEKALALILSAPASPLLRSIEQELNPPPEPSPTP